MYQQPPPTPPYAQPSSTPYPMYNPNYTTQQQHLPPPPTMYNPPAYTSPPSYSTTSPPYGGTYHGYHSPPTTTGKIYQPPQAQQSQPTPHVSIVDEDNSTLWNYFSSVDVDQNGLIDHIELRNALSQGGYMFDEEVTRRLIRMFDKNNNNKIDFSEFADLHAYLSSMKNAFYRNDINKNGVLDYFEVERCLTRAGYTLDRSTLWKIFSIYDTYQQGNLHFDGYMKMCIFLGTVRNTFQMNDKTQSGQVTFSFQSYLQNCLNFA